MARNVTRPANVPAPHWWRRWYTWWLASFGANAVWVMIDYARGHWALPDLSVTVLVMATVLESALFALVAGTALWWIVNRVISKNQGAK